MGLARDIDPTRGMLPPSPPTPLPPSTGDEGSKSHWLRDNVVYLRTNHRSHPGIREAATAINAQDAAIVDRLPRFTSWVPALSAGGCWLWEQSAPNPADVKSLLHSWADHVFNDPLDDEDERETFLQLLSRGTLDESSPDDFEERRWLVKLFRALDRTRLLTLVREGPWGCNHINQFLQDWLRRRIKASWPGPLFPGVPVLITRNDRLKELSNGDVGLALPTRDDRIRVVFPRKGSFVSFAPEQLPSHELGFALTVHKSQGSEYEQVLLVLPPLGGKRLLTKELLYTAITRAKRLAVIVATAESARDAIKRRVERESGMTGS